MAGFRLLCAATALHCVAFSPVFAGDTANTAKASCLTELRMTPSACDCIGESAERELNAKEQIMFLAVIKKDQEAIRASQASMTPNELMKVANFMTATPAKCAQK